MQNDFSPQQNSMPDWFANSTTPLPEPKPRRKHLLVLLLVAATTLLIVIGGVVIYLTRPTCLTADDYQQLTGQKFDGTLSPASSFYSAAIDFSDDPVQFDSLEGGSLDELVSLSNFYEAHSSSSLIFTIATTYGKSGEFTRSAERSQATKSALLAMGVPDSIVVVEGPTLVTADAAETNNTMSTVLSLTSAEGCR